MKPNILLAPILAAGAMTFAAPVASAQERQIAEIFMVGANFCPRGSAAANGQILPIAQNSALFALLGTTYGGDGRTTFALPDLRGRFPMNQGAGPGLTQRRLGEKGGSESHTLTTLEMPSHTHGVSTQTGDASRDGGAAASGGSVIGTGAGAVVTPTSAAGGSQPVSVMNPYLGVQFCIALQGIFPSRD